MSTNHSAAEQVAQEYYDSSDADRFYELVWGGEDIHIGMYAPGLSIFEASRRTVAMMADQLHNLTPESRILDLGAGYGGAARYLAKRFGCKVTCLNLSEVQNQRNRMLNQQQGLQDKIEVLHGSFEAIPGGDAAYDLIWSQDAFLHSGRKDQVVAEIARVLAPGGELIFTDPMQADNCPEGVLQPVYDRLHLDSLASIAWYTRTLTAAGLSEIEVTKLTPQLRTHYATVQESLKTRYADLSAQISKEYLDRMIAGLGNWVDAADQDYLAWGILHFRKAD